MANKLKVQEQEAIANLYRLGWGIRRIARELGLSRNTVRSHVRSISPLSEAEVLAEEILNASDLSPPSPGNETDSQSSAGSATGRNQTDPLSTPGNTGRKSLCADHAELILAKFEEGLMSAWGFSILPLIRSVRPIRPNSAAKERRFLSFQVSSGSR